MLLPHIHLPATSPRACLPAGWLPARALCPVASMCSARPPEQERLTSAGAPLPLQVSCQSSDSLTQGVNNTAAVMRYTGFAWASLGASTLPNRTGWLQLALDSADTPYLGVTNLNSPGQALLLQYNSSDDTWLQLAPVPTPTSVYPSTSLELAINGFDVPHIALQQGAFGGATNQTVWRWEAGGGGQWVGLGSPDAPPISPSTDLPWFSLAFDASNLPVVAFKDQRSVSVVIW